MVKDKKKIYIAFVFFLIMLLDAHLTRAFIAWGNGTNVWTTHLLLLVLMFCAPKFSRRYMLIVSIILGSIFDLYFMGILGVYAVSLPLVVWLMDLLSEILYQNIFTMFFGTIILITGYEVIVAAIQFLFKVSTISPVFFIAQVLGPTLLINMLFFFLLYFISSRLLP